MRINATGARSIVVAHSKIGPGQKRHQARPNHPAAAPLLDFVRFTSEDKTSELSRIEKARVAKPSIGGCVARSSFREIVQIITTTPHPQDLKALWGDGIDAPPRKQPRPMLLLLLLAAFGRLLVWFILPV